MQIFKTLFLFLCFCLFATISYAQTATLNEFSITAQPEGSSIPTVRVVFTGSNFEINGLYSSPEAFRICAPCERNDSLQFSRTLLSNKRQPCKRQYQRHKLSTTLSWIRIQSRTTTKCSNSAKLEKKYKSFNTNQNDWQNRYLAKFKRSWTD